MIETGLQLLRRIPPWPLLAGLVSALLLAAAHAFEHFGGLPPCALCLEQREAHWATLGVGLGGALLMYLRPGHQPAGAVCVLLGAGFVAGAAIAGFHVGVEHKWWPGLPGCAATTGGLDGDLLGALGSSMRVVRCDEVAWSFLGLSMAGWNMAISLVMAALSGRAAFAGGWLVRRPGAMRSGLPA
jgi:disulfide bond formation protein DsbB